MPTSFAPGARVEIRDAEWVIRKAEMTPNGQALHVTGLSDPVKDRSAIFLSDLEDIRILCLLQNRKGQKGNCSPLCIKLTFLLIVKICLTVILIENTLKRIGIYPQVELILVINGRSIPPFGGRCTQNRAISLAIWISQI